MIEQVNNIVVSITLEVDEAQEVVDALAQKANITLKLRDKIVENVSAQILTAKASFEEAAKKDKEELDKLNEGNNE